MAEEELIRLASKALADEAYSAEVYELLSRLFSGEPIRSRLSQLSRIERSHAEFWRAFIGRRGGSPDVGAGRVRALLNALVFRLIGLGLTLRILEMGEREAVGLYSRILESPEMEEWEREQVTRILEDELVHEREFEREESRFEDFITHVREAVLGMNDGLVEVLSVAAGLAGAYGSPLPVALGGLIVGIAGALSMGIGSFASVRAQRQIQEGTLQRIRMASRYVAHLFRDRVASYMARKGFSAETSRAIAEESSGKPELLSKLVAEEEHGLREESLESPLKAGFYTGIFYIVGALVPLIPYFLGLPMSVGIVSSLCLAGIALAFTGFMVAVSAGLAIKRKIGEMVLAGLGSAAITFAIGRLASIILGVEVG